LPNKEGGREKNREGKKGKIEIMESGEKKKESDRLP